MKKLMGCPAWLELSDDRTSFIFLEDRAEIVRYIFQLSIAGFGAYSIGKKLTANQTPTFKHGGKWDQSAVFNILNNRATFGEYVPGKYSKTERPKICGSSVANYYPAVIDEVVFNRSQAARRENWSIGRGRKGKLITNLFAGLVACSYCGRPMKFVSNGNSKSLVCEAVLDGLSCPRFGWCYRDFEQAFLHLLKHDEKVKPAFAARLSELELATKQTCDSEIYNARMNLAEQLRDGTISQIGIAAAGREAVASGEGRIVRDHPDRTFTVVLFDGHSIAGRPAPAVPTVRFNPAIVSQALGLTTRQGQLVAILAEGQTLSAAAPILQMTVETARWHLRQIFAAKDIHSQQEIIEQVYARCEPEKRNLS